MPLRLILVVALLVLSASSAFAASGTPIDPSTNATLRDARQALQALRSGAAIDVKERARIDEILGRAAQVEADAERGVGHHPTMLRAQLRMTAEHLERALDAAPPASSGPKAAASATITGKVFDAGSTPLSGVSVILKNPASTAGTVAGAVTDGTGTYAITVAAGTYLLRTNLPTGVVPIGGSAGYVNGVYNGISCTDALYCTRDVGTALTVADTATLTVSDFHLQRAGGVSGRVTNASNGMPLSGFVTMIAINESANGFSYGQGPTSATVGSEGTYQFSNLAPGKYRIVADVFYPAGSGFADMVWSVPPKRCATGGGTAPADPFYDDCSFIPVDYVTVNAGVITPNIDLALPPNVLFNGTLRDGPSGNPIAGGHVSLLSDDGFTLLVSADTDASGYYELREVRPGNYRLVAYAPGHVDIVAGAAGPIQVPGCDFDLYGCGIDKLVPMGDVLTTSTGNDLFMQPNGGASISGRITRADDGSPVAGIVVAASAVGGIYADATTDASGNYTIVGLPDAQVHVFTKATPTLTPTAYPNTPCHNDGPCVSRGASLRAQAATPLTGVDIAALTSGTITGVIRDAGSGLPVSNNRSRVEIWPVAETGYSEFGNIIGQYSATQSSGSGYTLRGVAPGDYYVTFLQGSRMPLVDQGYLGANSSVDCPRGGCDMTQLTKVHVSAGGTVTGIDGLMPRGAFIKGRATDAATGNPLAPFALAGGGNGAYGLIFNTSLGRPGIFANPDGAGNYATMGGVGAGIYFGTSNSIRQQILNNPGRSVANGYVDQNYSGVVCPLGSCGTAVGNAIPVSGTDVANINFAFTRGGTINGTVRRSSDNGPLRYVVVSAYNSAGKLVAQDATNIFGAYTLFGLPSGSYYVVTSNVLGYLNRAYNNLLCEPFCNPVASTAVVVTAPSASNGVDFTLDRASSIAGVVRNGGSPVANVPVELYGALGNLLLQTATVADGSYLFQGLPFNVYYVRTRNVQGLIDAVYAATPCVGDACQVRNGTAIDLSSGNSATGIDLSLTLPGSIGGLVTDQGNGNPLAGVSLQLLDSRGAVAFSTRTDGSGNYQFAGLASGNYYLVTRNTPGYVDETSDNKPCPESCNGLIGATLAVTAGSLSTANFQLSHGGSISGSVHTAPAPGTAISPSTVQVYNATGVPVGRIPTSFGNYQLFGLPDGTYFARTQNGLGYVDKLYSNFLCSGYCDVVNGTPIVVSGGFSTPAFVDFFLSAGGSISGTVRSSVSPFPGLPAVTVQAYDVNGLPAGNAVTSASGAYTVAGLKTGQYRLQTLAAGGYVNQLYSGKPCTPNPCDVATGTLISVSGAGVGPFDFKLDPGATISGTATDRFNNPLPSGTATLYSLAGVKLATAPVTAGRWEFTGLANGQYFLLISNTVGLVDQLYAGVPCSAGSCNITMLGTPITVTGSRGGSLAPSVGGTIDLQLADGKTISGHVQDDTTFTPLQEVGVFVFDASGKLAGEGVTDALGNYTIGGGFTNGTYYAATTDGLSRGVGDNYINELFGGAQCPLGCNVTAGTPITISGASVSSVNFSLGQGLSFGGTVRDNSGNPLSLVTITVVNAGGAIVGTFDTDSLGHYPATGLPAGTYYARTTNVLGLIDTLYGGAPCFGNCNVLTSAPITISSGNQPQNIDFTLPTVDVFKDGFE